MSVPQHTPSRLPDRVEVEIMGHEVAGTIVDDVLEAEAGKGPRRILTVDVGTGRYRVPAVDADPL